MNDATAPRNIPNPDPSLATNERLAMARADLETQMVRNHTETRGWVDGLQVLMERDLRGAVKNIETRLAGGDIALKAALDSSDKAGQKQADNFSAVLREIKDGIEKRFDSVISQINELKMRMSESGGRTQGIGQMVTIIVSAVAAIAAAAAVIITLSHSSAPSSGVHPIMGIGASWSHLPFDSFKNVGDSR